MRDHTLLFHIEGHAAFVTLNRPETGNVITPEVAGSICDACDRVNQDDNLRLMVLRAAGKDFCLGMEDPAQSEEGAELECADAVRALAGVVKPVVVAAQGRTSGPGLELALAGDIRLASAGAQFDMGYLRQGFVPHHGGTQRLPRLVGRGKALELLLTAASLDAVEAARIGLVSRVIAEGELQAEAEKLAASMGQMAPMSLRFAKETVVKGMDLTLEQGLRLEADLYFLMHTTRDRTEGITAFLQKRAPQFEGR